MTKKKRIVVVDDVRNYPFGENDVGTTLRTSAEALEFLGITSGKRIPIDELWLDFDLGGVFGQIELYDTCMPVALYLAELAFYGIPYPVDKIVIHTMNPVGRVALGSTLRHHGYNVEDQSVWFHV